MATLVGTTTAKATIAGTGSITVPVPSGIIDGDVLVLMAGRGDDNPPSWYHADWTPLEPSNLNGDAGSDAKYYVNSEGTLLGSGMLYKIVIDASNEPSSYTFTGNTGATEATTVVMMFALRGLIDDPLVDATLDVTFVENDYTPNHPDPTTTDPNSVVVAMKVSSSDNEERTTSPPTPLTSIGIAQTYTTPDDGGGGEDPPPDPPDEEYGAGSASAGLAVPAGAVSASPSNLANRINNNPSGTAFALEPGIYYGTFPNKQGNEYYGDPDNHRAVIFDGQATYPDPSWQDNPRGGSADGGYAYAFEQMSGNLWANMTFRKYYGKNPSGGQGAGTGPLYPANSPSNNTIHNVEMYSNQFCGVQFRGSGWVVRFYTSHHNGQYGFSGSGNNHLLQNFLLHHNGNDDTTYEGYRVPRFKNSDRGGSKIVFCSDVTMDTGETRDHEDQAIWADIHNYRITFRNIWSHDNDKLGIDLEASFGGHIIEDCLIERCAQKNTNYDWIHAGISVSMCSNTIVRNNEIYDCRSGITLYQWNHPQWTGEAAGNPGEHWCDRVEDCLVENNLVDIAGSNVGPELWAGIVSLSSLDGQHATDASANNVFRNNTYVGVTNSSPSDAFWWKNGSGARISYGEWKAKGLD